MPTIWRCLVAASASGPGAPSAPGPAMPSGHDRPRGGCTGGGIVRAVSVIILPRRSVTNRRVKRRVVHSPGTTSRHHRGCFTGLNTTGLRSRDVGVVLDAEHTCMTLRGLQAPGCRAWSPPHGTVCCAGRPGSTWRVLHPARSPAPPDPGHRLPNTVVHPSGEPSLKHGAIDPPALTADVNHGVSAQELAHHLESVRPAGAGRIAGRRRRC
jgi:hypothetical protein